MQYSWLPTKHILTSNTANLWTLETKTLVHLSVNLRKSRTQNNFCDRCLNLLCLLFEVSRWPLLQQADVVGVRQTVAMMQCSTCEHMPASVCSQRPDSHGSNPSVSCFLGCQTPPAQNENSFKWIKLGKKKKTCTA